MQLTLEMTDFVAASVTNNKFCNINARSHDLKRHIQRMHFICVDCPMKFGNRSEMAKHLGECGRTHKSDIKHPEELEQADQTAIPKPFTTTETVLRQKPDKVGSSLSNSATGSDDVTKRTCQLCSKVLSTPYNLRRHLSSAHSGSQHCQLCGHSFDDKLHLIQHAETCTNFVGNPDRLDGVECTGNPGPSLNIPTENGDSGLTSTPFPSRPFLQSSHHPELSPIFQVNPSTSSSLDMSGSRDDSGFQHYSNADLTFKTAFVDSYPSFNPLLLQLNQPRQHLNEQADDASIPKLLLDNKELTITRIDETEKATGSLDTAAMVRTVVILRTLQLAMMRKILESQADHHMEVKQEPAPEQPQNSSDQQGFDSGHGSNQNSDSETKSDSGPSQNNHPRSNSDARQSQSEISDEAEMSSERVKCADCEAIFPSIELLSRHRNQEHSRPFQCKECSKAFKRKDGLQRHVAAQHLNITLGCRQCGLSFKNKSYLDDHIRGIHERSQSFRCTQCDMVFPLKQALYRHTHAYHGVTSLNCRFCNMTLKTKHSLKRHEEKKACLAIH